MTDNGVRRPLDIAGLRATIEAAGVGLTEFIDTEAILKETVKNLYDGIPVDEVFKSAILSARALVEKDPAYSQVTARLLLHTIRKEVLGQEVSQADMSQRYADYFPPSSRAGSKAACCRPTCPNTTWPSWARRWTPAATCSSATSACKLCTTATSCTSAAPASNCRRSSSCAWPWAWR